MTARELAAHILRTAPGGTYGTIPIDRLTAAIEARDAEAANECQCPNCDGEAHAEISRLREALERAKVELDDGAQFAALDIISRALTSAPQPGKP